MRGRRVERGRLALVCVWFGLSSPMTLSASDFENYELAEAFNFPTIADPADQGPVVFDNLSDGRLLGVSTLITDPVEFLGTPRVYLETEVGSRHFMSLGDLPLPVGELWSSGGGAFLRVSAGAVGEVRIAVGNNDSAAPLVGIFTESDLLAFGVENVPIDWFELGHFSAAWFDDRHLAINSGDFTTSQVNLLDTDSMPSGPVHPLIVQGIEGASAGVGFDAAGNLYTANGAANPTPGGSVTGDIKRFEPADWQATWQGAAPLDFESQVIPWATLLSGRSLLFDQEDNLLVGGGDFVAGGQSDFFAVIPESSISSEPRQFDPNEDAMSFYVLSFNEVTGEFYATEPFPLDFTESIDNTKVYTFRPGLKGDMDCDGQIDFDDIAGWVLGLTDPQGYQDSFAIPPEFKGDIDRDGDLDFDDIDDFVALLSNSAAVGSELSIAGIPEPVTWKLATIGLLGLWIYASSRGSRRFDRGLPFGRC